MNGDLQHLLALLNIKGIGSATTRQLIEQFGSAKDVLEARVSDLSNIGNIGELVLSNRSDPAIMARAEAEIEFIEKNNIQCGTCRRIFCGHILSGLFICSCFFAGSIPSRRKLRRNPCAAT